MFDKFLPEPGQRTIGRRALGRVISAIRIVPNRRFSEIIQESSGILIEKDDPVLLNGQYRVLLLKKQD